MDKVAMYKEWIYEGEIEKTALNAAMKRVKSLMQSGRVDAPGRIDRILDKVDKFPTIEQMPLQERAKLVKAGLKGDRSIKWVLGENRNHANEVRDMYRNKTGRDPNYIFNRKPDNIPASWDLEKKLRANKERYNQKKLDYKW